MVTFIFLYGGTLSSEDRLCHQGSTPRHRGTIDIHPGSTLRLPPALVPQSRPPIENFSRSKRNQRRAGTFTDLCDAKDHQLSHPWGLCAVKTSRNHNGSSKCKLVIAPAASSNEEEL